MSRPFAGVVLSLAAAGAFALLSTTPAAGQGEAIKATEKAAKGKAKAGPTPRLADGKVDFSGIWGADRTFIYDISETLKKGESLPLQPWAEKTARERMSKDDPEALCLPTGVPRQAPYPWRIVQTGTHMYFLFEGNIHSYRQIFLDGRKHPEDPDPTWYGHSVGTWVNNDTLSIDTVGFNDKFWFDFAGHPHTEKLHTVEKFTRPNHDRIEYEVTIDDPGAYTKPFVMYGKSNYSYDTELMEFICNENNQDVDHIVGKDPRNRYSKDGKQ
jgi:hypothetical protein